MSLSCCVSGNTCRQYIKFYLATSITKDTDGCRSLSPLTFECRNLHDALQNYHQLTHKKWLSCVEFHLKSSQKLDGLEGSGIIGIGEPNYPRGSHAHVKFALHVSPFHKKQSFALEILNVTFKFVVVNIQDLSAAISHCTLHDSSLFVDSKGTKGNSITISNSTWKGVFNSTVLDVANIDRANIRENHILSTIFNYSNIDGGWNVFRLKHVALVDISNVTINDTVQMWPRNFTGTSGSILNFFPYKTRRTHDALEGYGSVIRIQHSDYVGMTFVSINNTLGGGALALHNVSNCKIECSNFTNNVNVLKMTETILSGPGGALLSSMSNLSIYNCRFLSNVGDEGGAIMVSCLNVGLCSQYFTYVNDTMFWNNSAIGNGYGGGIYTTHNLSVHNCIFLSNWGYQGGAIFSLGSDEPHSILAYVRGSFFRNNSGIDGGAIYTTNNLTIVKSNFTENIAEEGAAIFIAGSLTEKIYLNMQHVHLYNNVAREGGSLMAFRSSIYMCNINITVDSTLWKKSWQIPEYVISGHQVYSLLSDLNASYLDFDIQALRPYDHTFVFIFQSIPSRNSVILNNYRLTCPDGFTFSPGIPYNQIECPDVGCMILVNYHPACVRRPPYMYLSQRDGYRIFDPRNGSAPIQLYVKSTPKPCPIPGGNCSFGCPTDQDCSITLRPLPGYWGQFVNGIAHFLQCPPEYCCWGPDCHKIDSCNEEYMRTGVLCSECPTDYTVALFSEKCIEIRNCHHIWPIFAIVGLVFFCVSFSIFLGIPEKTSTLHAIVVQINKRIHGDSGESSHTCHMHHPPSRSQTRNDGASTTMSNVHQQKAGPSTGVMRQSDAEVIEHGNQNNINDQHENVEGNDRSTANEIALEAEQCTTHENLNNNDCIPSITNIFLQCALTVSFYIQDVTLYYSHLIDYVKGSTSWLQSLSSSIPLIRNIINFHTDIMLAIDKHTCMFPGMSPAEKVVLKTSVYPLSLMFFGLLYLGIFTLVPAFPTRLRCCAWLKRVFTNDKTKTNLSIGFLICVSLSYQQITLTALNLVKCIKIYDNRQDVMITALWLDATTECYTAWQQCVICIIVLYCFALPFYLIFAPGKLQCTKISSRAFILGLLMPGLFLTWWLLVILFGVVCPQGLKRKITNYIRRIPYLDIFRRPGYIDLDAPPSSPVRDAIIDHVCGPYKVSLQGRVNWSGIIQMLRLILVFCSVIIENQSKRVMVMRTISLVSLSIHAGFTPLKSKAMNVLAFLCQVVIVFVAGFYIDLASLEDSQASPVQNNDRIAADFSWINVFSVIIPGVCIGITILCGLIPALKSIVGKCTACWTGRSNQARSILNPPIEDSEINT